jgi:pre-mRNA-processing factor SLU7
MANASRGPTRRYGGEEHLKAPPKELLMAQSEHYVEYSKLGRVIKGQDKAIARSKYLEDQFPGNHKSVWGSYWRHGQWGYACCHSLFREAYCAGEAGKAAAALSDKPFMAVEHAGGARAAVEEEEPAEKSMVELHMEKRAKDAAAAAADNSSDSGSDSDETSRKERRKKKKKERKERKRKKNGGDDDDDDEDEEAQRAKKIREAMKKQKAEDAAAEEILKTDERTRKYGAIGGSVDEPTEEEMEAYRLRQGRADDPMNQFLNRS